MKKENLKIRFNIKMKLFILVCIIVVIFGICPNNCSGHGKCVDDKCECFDQLNSEKLNFIGSDCSLCIIIFI